MSVFRNIDFEKFHFSGILVLRMLFFGNFGFCEFRFSGMALMSKLAGMFLEVPASLGRLLVYKF